MSRLEEYLEGWYVSHWQRRYMGDKVVEHYLIGDGDPEEGIYSYDVLRFGMNLPFEKLPLYVNTTDNDMKDVLQYRLKQGA